MNLTKVFLCALVVATTLGPAVAQVSPPAPIPRLSVSTLRAQLNALPRHKASYAKIEGLVLGLARKDIKKAATYLLIGFTKIASDKANGYADRLGGLVRSVVEKDAGDELNPARKRALLSAIRKIRRAFTPPPNPNDFNPY